MPLRSSSLRALSVSALALAGAVHCTDAREDGHDVAEAAHTEGIATGRNTPFMWIETDPASMEAEGSLLFGSSGALPSSDPITQRLQLWLDRFHQIAVRTHLRTETERDVALLAPRPIIQVRNSSMPNAWVSPLVGCAGGPVDLTALAPPGGPEGAASSSVAVASPGRVRLTTKACVPSNNWSVSAAPAFLNALGGGCTFTQDGASIAVTTSPAGRCTIPTYGPSADSLGIEAASHFIQATTALVASLEDELSLAFMLAHELAHYYRAHPSELDDFDYWYEQHSPPRPGKPPPVPDSAEYQKRFVRFGRPLAPPIDGERTSVRLRTNLSQLARTLGPAQSLDPACAALGLGLGGGMPMGVSSDQPVPPAVRDAFLAFQDKLYACAATVRVSDDGAPGTIPTSTRGLTFGTDTTPVGEGPLLDAIAALDRRAREVDAEHEAFLLEANARRLGHYTYEQESDDVALELLVLAGFQPERVVDAWAALMKNLEAWPDSKQYFKDEPMTVAECAALREAGWTRTGPDGAAEAVYVPLGKGKHHSFCYRLFNLSREVRAHGYVAAPTSDPRSPWSNVRALAATHLGDKAEPVILEGGEEPEGALPIYDPF